MIPPVSTRRPARLLLLALLWPFAAVAEDPGPTGTWQTIDDDSGEVRSLVEITEQDGELRGRVVAIIDPPVPDPVCKACEGARQGEPIKGMEILWGLTREDGAWTGGRVLDPESGKIYKARAELADEGQKLKLRGYVGVSLFGRTQTWQRASEEASE